MTTSLTSVHSCGHSTATQVTGFPNQSHRFEFVLAPCTPNCAYPVDPESPATVTSLAQDRQDELNDRIREAILNAENAIAAFDALGGMLTDDIQAAGNSAITALLLADERGSDRIAEYLGLQGAALMTNHVAEFAQTAAAFSDFCVYKAGVCLQVAQKRLDALNQAVAKLSRESTLQRALSLQTPTVVCLNPGGYDPSLGVAELAALRESGTEGRGLLRIPISEQAILDAAKLIDRMRSGMNPADSTATKVSIAMPIDELEAYLQSVQEEFQAELAAKRAQDNKGKRTPKRAQDNKCKRTPKRAQDNKGKRTPKRLAKGPLKVNTNLTKKITRSHPVWK